MSSHTQDKPRSFQLGKLFVTPGVIEKIKPSEVFRAVARHEKCDWGIVNEEDQLANDEALIHDARILSAYKDSKQTKFWVITEADRSATTVLLSEEY